MTASNHPVDSTSPRVYVTSSQAALFAAAFVGASVEGQPIDVVAATRHLEGEVPLVVEPALDGMCRFVVLSFHRRRAGTWKSDAIQLAQMAATLGVSVYLERLAEGTSGAHVWVFLDAPVDVTRARRLASALLLHASGGDVERLASFDQVYPSRVPETLTLPLFGRTRGLGENVFVEARRGLPVMRDPLALLASLRRVDLGTVARIIGEPVESSAPPMAPREERVDLVVSASLVLARPLPVPIAARLRARLSYPNPEYQRRVREGLSVRRTRRLLPGWRKRGNAWLVPKGLEIELTSWCEAEAIAITRRDVQVRPPAAPRPIPPGLTGEAPRLLERMRGRAQVVLAEADDFTRTTVALAAIAERGVATLVLAANKSRVAHWCEQALLGGFEEHEVAPLHEPRAQDAIVAVGTYAEVAKRPEWAEARYGLVVADDCTRVSIDVLRDALESVPASATIGLADEGGRPDGLDDLAELLVGPTVRAQAVDDEGVLDVVLRTTRFVYVGDLSSDDEGDEEAGDAPEDELFAMARPPQARTAPARPSERSREWNALLDAIARDVGRNEGVARDVAAEVAAGRRCLVLTARREHAQALTDWLSERDVAVAMLTGEIKGARRREALDDLREGRVSVLVVTEQLLGPGFDPSTVTRVFLAAPLRSDSQMRHTVALFKRASTPADAVRLYDYIDEAVPRLARMATARRRFYGKTRTTLNPDAMQLRLPFEDA